MYLNLLRGCLLARSPCSMLCTQSTVRRLQQQVQQDGEFKGIRDDVSDSDDNSNMGQHAYISRSEENPAPAVDLQEEADQHNEMSSMPGSGPSAIYCGGLGEKDSMFHGLTEEEIDAMTDDERLIHMQEKLVEKMKRTLEEDTELSKEERAWLKQDLRDINIDLAFAKKFGIMLRSIV